MVNGLDLNDVALMTSQVPVRLPEDIVDKAICSNSNEFKAISQSPLLRDQPIQVGEARKVLLGHLNEEASKKITAARFNSVLVSLDPQFIVMGYDDEGTRTAYETKLGHILSQPLGGHLLNLTYRTNIPLRHVIGETKGALYGKNEEIISASATKNRISLYSILLKFGHNNGWVKSEDLYEEADQVQLSRQAVRLHIGRLIGSGLVERKSVDQGRLVRYAYRLRPNDNYKTPKETVEDYLAIVVLSSLLDKGFIDSGLEHLNKLSSDPKITPSLITRSFVNTKHTGKNNRRIRL